MSEESAPPVPDAGAARLPLRGLLVAGVAASALLLSWQFWSLGSASSPSLLAGQLVPPDPLPPPRLFGGAILLSLVFAGLGGAIALGGRRWATPGLLWPGLGLAAGLAAAGGQAPLLATAPAVLASGATALYVDRASTVRFLVGGMMGAAVGAGVFLAFPLGWERLRHLGHPVLPVQSTRPPDGATDFSVDGEIGFELVMGPDGPPADVRVEMRYQGALGPGRARTPVGNGALVERGDVLRAIFRPTIPLASCATVTVSAEARDFAPFRFTFHTACD